MSRRPPLHTVGASILAIIHNACTRARDLNGPVGSLTKRITTLMSSGLPIIYTMQHQWLAILFFADDYILTLENMVEKFFPSSVYFFNGIDRLVWNAECLPKKFDDALNTLPQFLHHKVPVPFLDWALLHLISWLNFLISTLTLLGSKSTKEKDIMVDGSCKNPTTTPELSSWTEAADSEKQINADECPCINPFQEMTTDADKVEGCVEINPNIIIIETKAVKNSRSVGMKHGTETETAERMKCSYKEILEKGAKEEDSPGSTISEERIEIEREKDRTKKSSSRGRSSFNLNDPILELYDASWHLS